MASPRLLVLDISDRTVAGLTAEVHRHSYVVRAASTAGFANGGSVADALREVVAQCGGASLNAHISLPASMFSFRNPSLPFTDSRKIDGILHYELMDSVGLGDEPIHYDAIRLSSNGTHTTLLAAVIAGTELNTMLAPLQELGVKPVVVTVSGFALALQMIDSGYGADRPVACLDAGSYESSVIVSEHGRVRSVRALRGDRADRFTGLAEEVRRTLLALDIADDCPIFIGGSAGSDRAAAERFRERSGFADIVLVDMDDAAGGESSPLAALPRHLRSKLSSLLQVEPADERLLNLAPQGRRRGGGLRQLRRFALPVAACCAALLVVAGYQLYDFNRIRQERAALMEQAAQIFSQTLDGRAPQNDPVRELEAEIAALEQSAAASIVGNPRITAVAVLSDLTARIPPAIRVGFDHFSFDRRQVRLDGVTDAYNDVDAIRKGLAESALYASVSIDSARTMTTGAGVRFSLILNLIAR